MSQALFVPESDPPRECANKAPSVQLPSILHALELYPVQSKLQTRSTATGPSPLLSLDRKATAVKPHANISTNHGFVPRDNVTKVNSAPSLCYNSNVAHLQARVKAKLGEQLFGSLKKQIQKRQELLVMRSLALTLAVTDEIEPTLGTRSTYGCSLHESDERAEEARTRMDGNTTQAKKARYQLSKTTAPTKYKVGNLDDATPTATQCSWRPEKKNMYPVQPNSTSSYPPLPARGERIRKCDLDGLPTWEVDQTSSVELVRIHRLKGDPNHNRGLFAGLQRFVTRSGLFIVGLTRGPYGQRIRTKAYQLLHDLVSIRKQTSSGSPGQISLTPNNASANSKESTDDLSLSNVEGSSDNLHQNLIYRSRVWNRVMARAILSDQDRAEAARRLKSIRERAIETKLTLQGADKLEVEDEHHKLIEGGALLVQSRFSPSDRARAEVTSVQVDMQKRDYKQGEDGANVTSEPHSFFSLANTDGHLLCFPEKGPDHSATPIPLSRSSGRSRQTKRSDSDELECFLDRTLCISDSKPPDGLQDEELHGSVSLDPTQQRMFLWGKSTKKSRKTVATSRAQKAISNKASKQASSNSVPDENEASSFLAPKETSLTLPNLLLNNRPRPITSGSTDENGTHRFSAKDLHHSQAALASSSDTMALDSDPDSTQVNPKALGKVRQRHRKGTQKKALQNLNIGTNEKLEEGFELEKPDFRLSDSEEHAQLNKAVTRILDHLDFEEGTHLGLAKFSTFMGTDLAQDGSYEAENVIRRVFPLETGDAQERYDIRDLEQNIDDLQSHLQQGVQEDLAELIAKRNQLRVEVENQRQLIDAFSMDLQNLSKERRGSKGDAFAIQLTGEVNQYAIQNGLNLQEIYQDLFEDEDASIEGVTENMLRRFVRGKVDMHSVGTQVKDCDLGYLEDDLRETVEQMDEIFYHEQALRNAIDLTQVALSNVIGFHTSLEIESTCKECFFLFEHPRTLWPCGHTFCQLCLTDMYNKNDELICTECGSICTVGYTPNLSMELIASYQVLQDAKSKSSTGGKTIESTLQSLLNCLMATQENHRSSVIFRPPYASFL